MRIGLIVGIIALLLFAGIVSLFQPGNFSQYKGEDRTNQLNGLNDQKPAILRINSIEIGENIKKQLNQHPSIKAIKHNDRDKSHYIDNQVTVKFKAHPSDQEMNKILHDIDGTLVKNLDSVCIFHSNSQSTDQLMTYFHNRTDVVYVEPNFIYLQNQENLPNDYFYYDYQWNLPMINTEAGWNITQGKEDIQIAVIDTGVDLDHPDLVHRLAEGYNVLADNNQPDDDNGHGTHVAGIIASETNNGEGVAGITWYNRIIPVKAMGAEGYGTSFDIAKGIKWAVDHGADVINMSLGNYQPSHFLKEAIDYAIQHDVVLIAASGNDNTNQPSFPAAYPEVLSVAAVGWDGNRASFSNYGEYIDVSAPGVEIASTYPNGEYAALSGTSMAAPHVAALAGLIRSINPELKNTEVVQIIKESTVDLGDPGTDEYYGSGLINIEGALQRASFGFDPFDQLTDWMENLD